MGHSFKNCFSGPVSDRSFEKRPPGARFSKVPKLFRWHNSLGIFKTKVFRVTKLCSYFNFDSLYNMWKDQLYRISGSEFTNGFSGPKSLRDFREKSPRGPFLGRPGDLVIGPEKQFLKLGSACREMLLFYMQNNCHVSKLETCCYWRYKEIYVTGKVSGRSRNGPQLAVSCEHINIFIKHLVVSWSLSNCVQIIPFFKFKLRSFHINVSKFLLI